MNDPRLQSEASLERANDPLELMRVRCEKIRLYRHFVEQSPQIIELRRQAQVAEQAARVASSDQVTIAPEPEVTPVAAAPVAETADQAQTAQEALARVMAIHDGESYDQAAA